MNIDLQELIQCNIDIIPKLVKLGILKVPNTINIREYHVGKSNYSDYVIQPWAIWGDYPELTSWDDDIIKRVLRTKDEGTDPIEDRLTDYRKIVHICQARIRQLSLEDVTISNNTAMKISDYKVEVHNPYDKL